MSLLDPLRAIDLNDPGRWPPVVRAAVVAATLAAVLIAGARVFAIRSEFARLEAAQREEVELRARIEQGQRRAAGLEDHRQQLAELELSYGAALDRLSGAAAIPGLLADISRTGSSAGLEEQLFQPLEETPRAFHVELPIRMRLAGDYHELGRFVSEITAIPRLVTLHDLHIRPATTGQGGLVLELTARTYRHPDGPPAGPGEIETEAESVAAPAGAFDGSSTDQGASPEAGPGTLYPSDPDARPAAAPGASRRDDPGASPERAGPVPGIPRERLPQFPQAEEFRYAAAGRRSPFAPLALPASAVEVSHQADTDPNPGREREFLERYALDALRMVGSLHTERGWFGLVLTPEGRVHRLATGDYLGRNHGRVTSITPREVTLLERVADGNGGYLQRPTAITLTE